MDRNSLSTQLQSNSSQTKCLIQSLSDQSLSGNRQSNRFNGSRRRHNEAIHKNVTQSTQSGRQSSAQWRGRSRGSGSVAGVVDCDFWSDHLNGDSTAQLSDKLDNKKTYGSKKHNLNHLLNFTFDSRDQIRSGDHQRGHQRRGHHRGYNKEHFLQANCQFVVNDLNDYSIHLSNPDTSVDWNSVEEIRFNSLTAETYCPICLDSPVAPKMTRCGHIFCWSCALHYLALSDQKWRKCPICFDWIQSEDLRTVSSINKIDYKIGDFITLSLMKRKKGSTIASPAILYDVNHNSFEPLDGDPVISSYRKILIASPNQVLDQIIERERQQLLNQMIVDKDTPEVCFIENALDQLKVREDMVHQRCQLNTIDGSSADTGVVGEDNVDNRSDDDYYYFYQSEDGQHIYLHSLNVRILKQEFGSLESCPHKICAKIVETEWESMSEELRKRHRYLQHLPLTCEFRIVELEFNNELISEATLELFRAEVMNRQRMRSKRAREERRRERHIQVEQNKRIHGIYPRPKYMLDNMDQFPVCSQTPDALNPNSAFNLSESSTVEDVSLQPNYGTSPATEPEFPSFATMLREGKQNFAQTMTASKKATVNSKELATNESDDEYQRPTAHYSLSDAFAAALQLQLSGTDPQNDGNKKGSKKKKNKPKLLLSTGMNRKY